MSRRTWTLLWSLALVAALGLIGGLVTVPYVALGPGPTYNTLGQFKGSPVISVTGQKTFPTQGNLNMTTVSVTDQVTLFGALGLWASGRYALAPREDYFPPEKTQQQVEKENVEAFQGSKSSAELAALRYLHYPVKVLAGQIVKGSPAASVLQPGDRLLEVNGKPVATADQVRPALVGTKPGQSIELRFQHGSDAERSAQIQLGSNNDRPEGFLGLVPIDHPDVPFNIDIKLGDIGGPSAGLLFALGIIDKLTPDNLNDGKFIAGTGEIADDGTVGPIGGIPFKMIAAREAGATAFLVPAENCSEAKARSPEGLQLVRVASLSDAVHDLQAMKAGQPVPGC